MPYARQPADSFPSPSHPRRSSCPSIEQKDIIDYVSVLNELCEKMLSSVDYSVDSINKSDNRFSQDFNVRISIYNNQSTYSAVGTGSSIPRAKMAAAKEVLNELYNQNNLEIDPSSLEMDLITIANNMVSRNQVERKTIAPNSKRTVLPVQTNPNLPHPTQAPLDYISLRKYRTMIMWYFLVRPRPVPKKTI